VGDHDGGSPLAEPPHRLGDAGLGGDIKVAGRLVQDEQGRVGEPGPGEGDQLALARREQGAALADLGVVALGEGHDHWLGANRPGRRLDLGPGRLRATEADVVGHRGLSMCKA
jgi:hypothetical protein